MICKKVDLPSENINLDIPFLKYEESDIALSLTFNFIPKKKRKSKELRMQKNVT